MMAHSPSVLDVLASVAHEHQCKQILYLGDDCPPLSQTDVSVTQVSREAVLETLLTDAIALSSLPAADLVIVGDVFDTLDQQQGTQLLAGLRNLLRARICALAPENGDWQFQDFIALGFKRLALCERDGESLTVYSYAVADYNFTREWNNARFWANPENFGKYWW